MAASREYLELLRDPRWQRKKNRILERDNYECRFCRDSSSNLQVHHRHYVRGYQPWDYEDRNLVTLCASCHERATKLIDRAKEILGDLNMFELPAAVATMERYWTKGAGQDPLLALLDRFGAERNELTAEPFTRAASRRVEALDELTDRIWAYIQAGFVEGTS